MVFVLAEWNLGVAVVVVVIVATTLYRWRRWQLSFFKRIGIPGPEPCLIARNFDQLWTEDTIKVMNEWSTKYGDIYGIYIGDAPFLMVKDLELLRRVLITDFALFTDRGDVWATMNGNKYIRQALSFAKGDRWKFTRRSVSPAFTALKMRKMVGEMTKTVERFLDLLEARCREAVDGEANVYPLLGSLAFDVVAETACGLYLDVQHKPNDQYFYSARSFMLNVVENAYQRTGQFFSKVKAILSVTCMLELQFGSEPLTALARKAEPIAALRARDQSLARQDVLQSLLNAKVPQELLGLSEFRERVDDKGHFLMPLRHVATNTATVLVAGFETVSAIASTCVFCLAKYPEIQEKVREEVIAAYEKHGGFTYDAINDLSYTKQTIDETMRLYPPVIAFTSRKASCDYHYKDMIIPKDVSIMACTEQIHRDPRFWDRPEEFDPDRFSPEQKASRHPLAFQPFGAGARNCIGMRLAQVEMTLIVAKLVYRFRLHLGSRHANSEFARKTQSIIASPKNGVWIQVEKIQKR
ncbi:cytochrome P450 3A5-like [Dermacentor albipictus]|uniref:cytochrome P450 3A5-like n=1 Tax=Dermacentor albipictus TaxID=60249 RepID=UPI0038FC0296